MAFGVKFERPLCSIISINIIHQNHLPISFMAGLSLTQSISSDPSRLCSVLFTKNLPTIKPIQPGTKKIADKFWGIWRKKEWGKMRAGTSSWWDTTTLFATIRWAIASKWRNSTTLSSGAAMPPIRTSASHGVWECRWWPSPIRALEIKQIAASPYSPTISHLSSWCLILPKSTSPPLECPTRLSIPTRREDSLPSMG